MKNKNLASLLSGYEDTTRDAEPSFFSCEISGRVRKRRAIAPLHRLADLFSYTTLRAYGAGLLTFGLLTIIIQFAKTSLSLSDAGAYPTLISGALSALIGAVLLAFDKPIYTALEESAVLDYVLYDFLRMRRAYSKTGHGIPIPILIVSGFLLSAIGYFVPAPNLIGALAIAIYVALSMASPEFSLYTTLIALPIIPIFENDRLILTILIAVCALSFCIKVAAGKRVYRFEKYDFVIIIMLVFILVSGIFSGGVESFTNSLSSIIIAFGYFTASSIITNRRLFESALTSVAISSIPVSVICITEFVKKMSENGGSHSSLSISAAFSSSSSLAAYLTVALICTYLMFKYYDSRPVGIFFALLLLVEVFTVLIAFKLDVLFAISVTALVIHLASKNRKMLYLTIVIYVLLHLIYFIPQNIISALTGNLGELSTILSSRAEAFAASLKLLSENLLLGVGIGREPFSGAIYESCGVAYESCGSLILQMACEGGIFVPLSFLWLMLVRVRHSYKYLIYARKSLTSASLTMSGIAYAILILGLFGDVFQDATISFLFFAVFGIGSAMMRASKREHDEKVAYFTDTLSMYSSTLDLDVSDRKMR